MLFDTWTRNCDRHPPDPNKRRPNRDNVFLSREGAPRGRLLLKAMDNTHCFTCGHELAAHLADIGNVKDEGRYGLFPEFWPYLSREVMREAVRTLRAITEEEVRRIVESIPKEWQVSAAARAALVELITRRAAFVSDHIEGWLWPQREFDFEPPPKGETP